MKQKTESNENILFLDFFPGRNGKPVARTESGKICLLNFEECKKNKVYVHEGEQWKCRIDEEHEKKIIVTPLAMTLDKEESGYFMVEKIKLLAEKKEWKISNK